MREISCGFKSRLQHKSMEKYMCKIFYLFLFTSLIYSNDDTHTLTEFEIVTINSFSDSGFSGISDDYTVINNLMKSNFYSTDSNIHFGMYKICLGNDELGCANLHINRAIQIDSKQTYYDLSDSLTLYREFLENARRVVSKENYDIGIEDYENIIERFSGKGLPYYELGLIFDKLNDQGWDSLTSKEEEFLTRSSKHLFDDRPPN